MKQKQRNHWRGGQPSIGSSFGLQSEAKLRKRVSQQIQIERPFKVERSWSRSQVDTLQKSDKNPQGSCIPPARNKNNNSNQAIICCSTVAFHSLWPWVNPTETTEELLGQLVWWSKYTKGLFHSEIPRFCIHFVFKWIARLPRGEGILLGTPSSQTRIKIKMD